jgi:hypothetical protein
MSTLSLETFLTGPQDLEAKQYLILQGLGEHYNEFSRNRLYPSLSELLELFVLLEGLVQKKSDIEGHLPQRLKEIDLENMKLVYEPVQGKDEDLEKAIDLINWALPQIKKTLDEGMDIYNFVDDQIAIEEVGIMPMYREEGYWFVPESRASQLHLLRYEVSLFTSAKERFRTLKTTLLESIEQAAIAPSPESIKLELIKKYNDLPNPATYTCETDLDFPYSETILPVAKRKLMAHLFS